MFPIQKFNNKKQKNFRWRIRKNKEQNMKKSLPTKEENVTHLTYMATNITCILYVTLWYGIWKSKLTVFTVFHHYFYIKVCVSHVNLLSFRRLYHPCNTFEIIKIKYTQKKGRGWGWAYKNIDPEKPPKIKNILRICWSFSWHNYKNFNRDFHVCGIVDWRQRIEK